MPELLIGCGTRRTKQVCIKGKDELWDGLVTLDHDPRCNPDFLHDLEDIPYPFADNQFDNIHAYHVLEHVGRHGDWRFFFAQFTELWRITKPDGLLRAVVPMWNSPWAWGDPSHTRVIQEESLVFLDQRNYEGVGATTMTDFRETYKVSWEVQYAKTEGDELIFVLKAVKP